MMAAGSRSERWILRLLVLVLVVLAWEGLCRVGWASEFWVSRPFLIVERLWEAVRSSVLWFHMGVTVIETVSGFLLGALAGTIAGFALARWRRAHVALEPYLMGIYSLPRVALAPLFIMWFGIGIPSKIMLAISIVFFILLINTYVGVQNVDRDLVNAVKTMGASPRFVTRHVVLPSCIPWIFSGLRISMALALTASVVGEMLAAQYGLGFMLARASGTFDTTGIFMVLFVLALLAIGTYNLMARLEKRLLHWQGETAQI
ncbi:MAG TPA: ABC transporter permease [Methylomirabilota bacterium]|nr:ABC transporter permease [Methylomirabilota bacterium]